MLLYSLRLTHSSDSFHIDELPNELLLHIFSYLEYGDIENLSKTNGFFHSLIGENASYLNKLMASNTRLRLDNWFKYDLKPSIVDLYCRNVFKTLNVLPLLNNNEELVNNYCYIYGLNLKQYELVTLISKLITRDRLSKNLQRRPSIDELIEAKILKLPKKYHHNYFYYYNDRTGVYKDSKIVNLQNHIIFDELIHSISLNFEKNIRNSKSYNEQRSKNRGLIKSRIDLLMSNLDTISETINQYDPKKDVGAVSRVSDLRILFESVV